MRLPSFAEKINIKLYIHIFLGGSGSMRLPSFAENINIKLTRVDYVVTEKKALTMY